jgi:hypothetical protein
VENDRPELHTKTAATAGQQWCVRVNQEGKRRVNSADVTRIFRTLAENAQDSMNISLQVRRESGKIL